MGKKIILLVEDMEEDVQKLNGVNFHITAISLNAGLVKTEEASLIEG